MGSAKIQAWIYHLNILTDHHVHGYKSITFFKKNMLIVL